VEPLIAALKDTDVSTRRNAVAALGNIGDAQSVKPIFAALNDNDKGVRLIATEALLMMYRSEGSLPYANLIVAVLDENMDVRRNAIGLLKENGKNYSKHPLVDALNYHSTHEHIRKYAAGVFVDMLDISKRDPKSLAADSVFRIIIRDLDEIKKGSVKT